MSRQVKLGIGIITAIIFIGLVAFAIKGNSFFVSKLPNQEYIGKSRESIMKDLGKPYEDYGSMIGYFTPKSQDKYSFDEKNICITHVQSDEKKYYTDIYKKLVKRKGEPIEKVFDYAKFKDGTTIKTVSGYVVITEVSQELYKQK